MTDEMTSDARALSKDFPEPLLAVMPILTSDGVKFPLVFRAKGNHSWWDFPGGKRKIDEDPLSALETECREEIDVVASVHAYIGSGDHPVKGLPKRHFMAASYISGTPFNKEPDQHLDMKLFNPHDAVNLMRPRAPETVRDYMLAAARKLSDAPGAPILKLDI